MTNPVPRRGTAGAILSMLVSSLYVLGAMIGIWASNQVFGKSEHPYERPTSAYVLGAFAIAGLIAATLALMKNRAGLWACALVHAGVVLFFVARIVTGDGSIFSAVPIAMSMPPAGLSLWAALQPRI